MQPVGSYFTDISRCTIYKTLNLHLTFLEPGKLMSRLQTNKKFLTQMKNLPRLKA